MRKPIFLLCFLFVCAAAFAQKRNALNRFAKLTPEDFQRTVYSIDSNANAVVMYDYGRSKFKGNQKNGFSIEHTHHRRVHILKKSGYSQGDVEVYLYTDGTDEERLLSVKAATYNLENGQVVESKLEKSAIFTDKLNKNQLLKKFTLPNIKEGSIIDYEYTTTSDFIFNLQPWSFQGSAPRLWSEYEVSIPQFLGYVFLSQGYQPFHANEKKDRVETFVVSDTRGTMSTENTAITSTVTDFRWVMKDVPELKEESFTTTLKNHVSRIEFQFSEYREPYVPKKIMQNWQEAAKVLMEREDFGQPITMNNAWMNDDIRPVVAQTTNSLDKAKKLYAFVRDNFICTDFSSFTIKQSLKNVLKTKKGTVSELNLLLTAMLRHENIDASPVILSTRSHGYTFETYPIMDRFNYVVCQAVIDGKTYNLDASRRRLGFGKMPYECYNGWARIINEAANGFNFSADSLRERKVSSLILIDDKGKWSGNFSQQLGYYESYNLRNKLKDSGEESFFKELQKTFGEEAKTQSAKVDSVDNYEAPLNLQYTFNMERPEEDILYLNPLFGEAQRENPFKSADRFYPVEMPYTIDETFVGTIHVPAGYEVEEMPKQIMVKLNEKNEGFFEYAIGRSGGIISMRTRVVLKRTFYAPDEYETLREFFNLIVKKQGEQIVFRKKN